MHHIARWRAVSRRMDQTDSKLKSAPRLTPVSDGTTDSLSAPWFLEDRNIGRHGLRNSETGLSRRGGLIYAMQDRLCVHSCSVTYYYVIL